MSRRPAAVSNRMNCALAAVDAIWASFCKPSRGPTSTMRTLLGNAPMKEILFDDDQSCAHLDDVAGFDQDFADPAGARRAQRCFHFHRFQDDDELLFGHHVA